MTFTALQIEEAKVEALPVNYVYQLTEAEAQGLQWSDVDLERAWLTTGTKGRPLSPLVAQALSSWRSVAGAQRMVLPFSMCSDGLDEHSELR